MRKIGLFGTTALRSATVFGISLPLPRRHGSGGRAAEQVVPPQPEPDNAEDEDEPEARNADGSSSGGRPGDHRYRSRIRLPNLQSSEPTVTVDFRQVRERNFTNVADALNELPTFRGSVTPGGAQGSFGQGVNFVNTYGLGSNRTLSLVNGRRFVSSNPATNFGNAAAGTQTDLNVIPDILLDRIDVVSIGGAPVYGSDAIAGTVNTILRSKYEGIEARGLAGISEEGDNFRWNGSVLLGGNLFDDRLNLTFAYSHDEVDGLTFNDRAFLRRNIGGVTNGPTVNANGTPNTGFVNSRFPGVDSTNDGRLNTGIGFNNSPTDFNPGTVLARQVGIPFLTSGGIITQSNVACNAANRAINPASCFGIPSPAALQFDPSGNLVPFNQGILFGQTNSASGVGGGQETDFLFNNFSQITSDLKRDIFYGFATLELFEGVELFAEGTHFRSRADELVQQPTFNSSLFGASLSGALSFNVNTPFLTPQARATLQSRGVTNFQVSRASTDLADPTGFDQTRINRGVVGARGDFQMFGRDFNFEAYYNYGRFKSLTFGQDLNAQNFINAVNVTTNAAGQIVCNPTPATNAAPGGRAPTVDPNCVPFNPLGFGVASQASRDYIIEDTITRSRQRQKVYNINFGGSFFDLPGGPLGFNVGYEHRDESASFTPSDFQQQGLGRSVAIVPLQGRYNLDEVFGEVLVPLVSEEMGLSFIRDARVFARGRYVDNTVNGGFFSWAVGGSIAPIRDIEFRGNFTRSFRSPAITELFLPQVNAFATVPDLCSAGNRNSGPGAAQPIRVRNCDAFLARFPNATPDPAATATVPIRTGGNPTLENEQADSYTFGVIVQPTFIPRFSLTADYISITLDQPISSLTVAQVTAGCFDNNEFNLDDPANGNDFCRRIRRGADGRVISDPQNPAVTVGFVNGQQIKFRGIQGTANYTVPMSAVGLSGNFSVGGDMLYVRRRLNNITGVNPVRSDGVIGDPEFSAQLRLRYVEDTFGTNITINYTGEQLFSRQNRAVGVAGSGPDAREIDELKDFVLVNGSVFFDPVKDFRFTFSVNNVFNRRVSGTSTRSSRRASPT
jgi:outer membrane receptor protein involved in Fe transport